MSDAKEEKVYTKEEIKGDGFAHTEWVQPARKNTLDATTVGGLEVTHRWTQYGNEAICDAPGHNTHATILNPMEMIVKNDDGSYEIKPVPILT